MHNIVTLRETTVEDLEKLFLFQTDKDAIIMAAFTPKDPNDKTGYIEKYTRLIEDASVNMKTILVGHNIAGSISKFLMDGEAEITYWIDRNYWSKGVATAALQAFLGIESSRPLFARTAFDNVASQKVLEKAGFTKVGNHKGYANAREAEIEEFIYKLE